jgi:hypothetical protein
LGAAITLVFLTDCARSVGFRTSRRERAEASSVGCCDEDKTERKEREAVRSRRGGIAARPSGATACARAGCTIVEQLDDKTLLVEFSDDQGHAYAIAPCPRADLLVLHDVPEAA